MAQAGNARRTRRKAFVLGNGAYVKAKVLDNPVNDARKVAARLSRLGFAVLGGEPAEPAAAKDAPPRPAENLTREATLQRLDAFLAALEPGDDVVFYYGGHGLQVADKNYLVPVDANLDAAIPLQQFVSLSDVVLRRIRRKIGAAGTLIVALDACREDPFDANDIRRLEAGAEADNMVSQTGSKTFSLVGSGFATFSLPTQDDLAPTFIMFATAPGELADDSSPAPFHKGHSPFAGSFVDHLPTRGLELQDFIGRVAADVLDATRYERATTSSTRHAQEPWRETNLNAPFYFSPKSWRPVWLLGALGGLTGLVTSWILFGLDGHLLNVGENTRQLLVGGIFAVVPVVGTMIWGSRKVSHALVVALSSAVSFMLALSIIAQTKPPQPGKFGAWKIQLSALMEHPELVAVTFLALLAGIVMALGTVLGLKAQRSNFRGFSAAVGAITVGLGVGVSYLVFMTLAYFLPETYHRHALIFTGAGWYAAFGAMLGYCFRHYVPVHHHLRDRLKAPGAAQPPR